MQSNPELVSNDEVCKPLSRNINLEADFALHNYIQECGVKGNKSVGLIEKWKDNISNGITILLIVSILTCFVTLLMKLFVGVGGVWADFILSFVVVFPLFMIFYGISSSDTLLKRSLSQMRGERFMKSLGLIFKKDLKGQGQAIYSFITYCESAAQKYNFYTAPVITKLKSELLATDLSNVEDTHKIREILMDVYLRFKMGFNVEILNKDSVLNQFLNKLEAEKNELQKEVNGDVSKENKVDWKEFEQGNSEQLLKLLENWRVDNANSK